MTKNQVSRRDFLKFSAVGAGVAAMGLAGCAASNAEPATADTKDEVETKESTEIGKSEAAEDVTEVPSTGTGNTSSGTEVGGYVKSSEAVISLDEGMPRWSFMIAPDKYDESSITETKTNDIIIVGGGMSGLTTAVAAAEKGGKVTLFSASSAPISRGGSNFAKNSKVMEELKIEPFDPVPFFYHEMRAASFAVDQRKWMRGYNNSEEAMNWMIDIANAAGLEVILERDNNFDMGPYYAHAFSTEGNSAMVSTGQQGAVEALAKKAEDLGVEIVWDMRADYLEREGDKSGRITGVIATDISEGADDTKHTRFEANKAVVLATGDFSRNKEMLACYCPEALQFIGYAQEEIDYHTSFTMGGIYGGDGQKMGLWAGAAWQYANIAPMWQGSWGGSHEPLAFHMGLNVNNNTERYQREDISSPYSAHHLLSQPGNSAWGIWTAEYAQEIIDRGMDWYLFGSDFTLPPKTAEEMIQMWEDGIETKAYYKADTLEDLADGVFDA